METLSYEALEIKVKTLECLVQEAERLAIANRYTAAIMHEVNNPLEAIVNLTYLLVKEDLSTDAREYLRSIEEQLTVLIAITRPSLGFHREQKASKVIDLRDHRLAFIESRKPRR